MSLSDEKRRAKERATPSSQEYFRNDHELQVLKHKLEQAQKEEHSIKDLATLRARIEEAKERSRVEQDRKKETMQAHERDQSAEKFTEKQRAHEEERQAAIRQGEPRQAKGPG